MLRDRILKYQNSDYIRRGWTATDSTSNVSRSMNSPAPTYKVDNVQSSPTYNKRIAINKLPTKKRNVDIPQLNPSQAGIIPYTGEEMANWNNKQENLKSANNALNFAKWMVPGGPIAYSMGKIAGGADPINEAIDVGTGYALMKAMPNPELPNIAKLSNGTYGSMPSVPMYKINPLANKLNNPNLSYRVAGMDAYKDFIDSGVLRSKPRTSQLEDDVINVGNRPTAFPAFNKGSADLRYLPKEGGVVFETSLPTYKRGETNPVTNLPIKGRHYAHRVIGENGEAVNSISKNDITVRESTPHWLRGYRKLDKNGNPININYGLSIDKSRAYSSPFPILKWEKYDPSHIDDNLSAAEQFDNQLSSMYKKEVLAAMDNDVYDYTERKFLDSFPMQIYSAEINPKTKQRLFSLNSEGKNEFVRPLEEMFNRLNRDKINNKID